MLKPVTRFDVIFDRHMWPLILLFWISSEVYSGFLSQSRQPYSHCKGAHHKHSLRSIFSATPADLLTAQRCQQFSLPNTLFVCRYHSSCFNCAHSHHKFLHWGVRIKGPILEYVLLPLLRQVFHHRCHRARRCCAWRSSTGSHPRSSLLC